MTTIQRHGAAVHIRRKSPSVAPVLAMLALATAVSFHSNFADQNQLIHFLKNVMMAGGLLQIVAFGADAISLDNRRNMSGLSVHPAAA